MSTEPSDPSHPVTAHGKFLSRAGSKFFLKAMRLHGPTVTDGFNARVELRARLAQLRAGHTTTVIANAADADGLLEMAAALDLHTLVELPVSAERLLNRTGLKALRAEVDLVARRFCGRPGLIGFLLCPAISADWLRMNGLGRIQSALAGLVRYLKRHSHGSMVAVRHQPSTRALAVLDEDFLYSSTPGMSGYELTNYIVSLHNMAESRPVVIELEAGCGDQDERIGCAFAAGAAGVVAPSFTAAPRTDALALIALNSDEVLPFVALNGNCPPALRKPPMVSVVICAYNAERTIGPCLESLRKLDYPNYEVVVVDDGSRDATAEIATRFPEFRLIRQPNKGLSVARNVGMQAALGEFIAYTDSDCVVDPHWLTFMIGAMTANRFDACGGPNYAPHEEGRTEACVSASPGAPCHVLTAEDRAEHLAGCNMVFRKTVLQRIGGFDPQFTAAGDDVDICWRALDEGFVLGFSPAAFVWHFRRNTVKAYYNQQRGYGKAEAMLYRKYPERFNALGQVMWRGRIPGLARTMPGRRNLVAWVKTSSGFFQTIYEPPMGLLKFLPQTLEWVVLWSALLAISLAAGFSALPGLLMLSLGPIWAAYYAWKAPLEKCHDSFGARLVVAFLAYTGPMFRTITRYKYRLAGGWPGRAGVDATAHQRPAIQLGQRALKLAYWSENGVPRDSLIDRLVKLFTRAALPVRVDSGWNDYDLEIQPDAWTRVRVKTADEEHEGGKFKTIVQAQVRFSPLSKVLLAVSTLTAIAAAVGLGTPSINLTLAGLVVVIASLALSEGIESGRMAYWAIEQCAAELSLVP
ncbi:MAG TPA: glycosyltransferase, partial [Candidatus Binataceae bacterium]|nr:glycosyltransferase [Candidatus Binataceae bacterium]